MVTDKPWGNEEVLSKNDSFILKRSFIKAGNQSSLHFHNEKKETIYVLTGSIKLTISDKDGNLQKIILMPNQSYTIESKQIHRLEAVQDCFYLEVSSGHLNDDISLQD